MVANNLENKPSATDQLKNGIEGKEKSASFKATLDLLKSMPPHKNKAPENSWQQKKEELSATPENRRQKMEEELANLDKQRDAEIALLTSGISDSLKNLSSNIQNNIA